MTQTLHLISTVACVAGVALFLVAIGVAIQFDIPKIFGQLTGRSARKGIRNLQARGFQGTTSAGEQQMAMGKTSQEESPAPEMEPGDIIQTVPLEELNQENRQETPSPGQVEKEGRRHRSQSKSGDGETSPLPRQGYAGGETVPLDEVEQSAPAAYGGQTVPLDAVEDRRPSGYAGGETVPLDEGMRDRIQMAEDGEFLPEVTSEMVPLEEERTRHGGNTVPLDRVPVVDEGDFVIVKREMKTQSKVVIPVQLNEG